MPDKRLFQIALTAAGLTYVTWAAKAGVSWGGIYPVISGRRRKSGRVARAITEFTAVQLEQLRQELNATAAAGNNKK